MTRIKICGITRKQDLESAAELKADYAGFIFVSSSKRFLTSKAAETLFKNFSSNTLKTVAVFQDPSPEEVKRMLEIYSFDLLQFHGQESPLFCASFNLPYLKAFSSAELNKIPLYPTPFVLIDAVSGSRRGGTGETLNWKELDLSPFQDRKIFIAGGITPENAGECMRTLHPYALDVSSGVEESPGIKSFSKCNLINTVRSLT